MQYTCVRNQKRICGVSGAKSRQGTLWRGKAGPTRLGRVRRRAEVQAGARRDWDMARKGRHSEADGAQLGKDWQDQTRLVRGEAGLERRGRFRSGKPGHGLAGLAWDWHGKAGNARWVQMRSSAAGTGGIGLGKAGSDRQVMARTRRG